MGNNCCVSYTIKLPSCIKVDKPQNQEKVLKIVKPDGKVLEFTKPTLVKHVLLDFTGYFITSSQEHGSKNNLPLNFELKIGEVYFLNPSPQTTNSAMDFEDSEKSSNTRRVRIVLTKTELKLLLANQVSMEDLVLQQLQKTSFCGFVESSSSSSWKPVLAAIPEE